jgi:N-acetyl-alpha-D-muramate 1-phosphate uridylyltransferase
MKAIIFAAGLGKRLGNITETIPKALVDINGKTALRRAVERCSSYGFDEIIVNVHHFADLVEAEIKQLVGLGYSISVSDERDKLLDTGGGLYKAQWFFDTTPFLIYNVDIISDLNLIALYKYHKEKKGLATLAVRDRPGKRVYLVDSLDRIRGWRNRSTGEQILAGKTNEVLSEIAFSSMHIVDPEIFKYMNDGVYSLTALYLDIAKEHEIYTFREDGGYWFDIGTPENLEEVRKFMK